MREAGLYRRDFLKTIMMAAAAVGLPATAAAEMAAAAAKGTKPSVVWLHFQECTGCTESLLRASRPGIGDLILDLISLDYHETLLAAAGYQAEAALQDAITKGEGKFVLVIEGSVPVKDKGIYCKVGGRTALDIVKDVSEKAGAIIAIGSCASWGGVQSTDPNPTGATGIPEILKGKTVVTLPGCPANPYNFLGVVLQYATYGKLPALDALGRPMFAYSRVIHSDCPRRPHFDAGRFAEKFGDEGHRAGYCLYKLGCKGPVTHANCSLEHFCDVVGAWPIGIGHPCVGCTEQSVAFKIPMFTTADIPNPTTSWLFPPINPRTSRINPAATGVAGLAGGALIGAGIIASKRISEAAQKPEKPGSEKTGEK
jgi:hydrogenase small subunit